MAKKPLQPSANAMQAITSLTEGKVRTMMARVVREKVAPLLHGFLIDNFLAGGKPRFASNTRATTFGKRVQGSGGVGHPLINKGVLFEKAILNPVIKTTYNSVVFQVRSPSARVKASANALHYGFAGSIFKTPAMRRYFWAMYFKAKEFGDNEVADMFMRAALSRVPGVTKIIRPRPWTKFPGTQIAAAKRVATEEFQKELNRMIQTGKTKTKGG